jgi:hypothetical protein
MSNWDDRVLDIEARTQSEILRSAFDLQLEDEEGGLTSTVRPSWSLGIRSSCSPVRRDQANHAYGQPMPTTAARCSSARRPVTDIGPQMYGAVEELNKARINQSMRAPRDEFGRIFDRTRESAARRFWPEGPPPGQWHQLFQSPPKLPSRLAIAAQAELALHVQKPDPGFPGTG